MNPFDDPDGTFIVVTDGHGRYALWPTFAAPVDGWQRVFGPAARHDCLAEVERLDETSS